MTKQEFIFSDQRRHRLIRHFAFWFSWCLTFNILFHFPIHVFKGWDLSGPGTRNLQELGMPLFFIKTLIVNSFFGVIVPQIILTYIVIYWLLPDYYFKRKNWFIAAVITVFVLLGFYFVALGLKNSPALYNLLMGHQVGSITFAALQRIVIIDQLSSLPIIFSLALMIKLVKRWWLKQKETEQLAREKVKAELQLLKAQIHPHFLFNTLNNIYFFAMSGSPKAPEMIKKLSGLLHYILNECDQPLVSLEKEIRMIQDYITLEKIRYGEQMTLSAELPTNCSNKHITPLLLIPFVENSFKHGASRMLAQPYVKLRITIEENTLHFFITNSKPQAIELPTAKARLPVGQGSIGLKNVKKRLELLYPSAHELTIIPEPENYTVYLKIKLQEIKTTTPNEEIKTTAAYAMA